MGPLAITAENMTDTGIDRITEDAKNANREVHIKDTNGKVTQTFNEKEDIKNNSKTSVLVLLSNLGSSTEMEQDTEGKCLRRSQCLTKTNPIVQLNDPVPSDYRKYRQKTERPSVNNHP